MTTDAESSGNGALMPAEMADAWAAVYLDVAEKIEVEERVAESVPTNGLRSRETPVNSAYEPIARRDNSHG